MIVRPVTAADLPAVHTMIAALSAYHDDVTVNTVPAMARDMLGDPPWVRVLVTETDNNLIG
jgi:hypothetical protein